MTVPRHNSEARYYHAEVSGEASLPQDRELLKALRRVNAHFTVPGGENRAFISRAVTYLAREGVRQFLDIGAGLPTWGNVHEVAGSFQPGAVVAYVDNDPEVVDRWSARLPDHGRIKAVEADLREPDLILGHPEVRSLIDFDEPMGLLLGAVLQSVADQDDPVGIVRTLVSSLPPGSFLVLSQVTGDAQPPRIVSEVLRLMAAAGIRYTMRSREEIARLFGAVDLIEPGVVGAPDWRPVRAPVQRSSGWYYAGVGRRS